MVHTLYCIKAIGNQAIISFKDLLSEDEY
jgi:hypothetical protein